MRDPLRAVSNTSPLLYLHRIGKIDWLRSLFAEILTPGAVKRELDEGYRRGHNVPRLEDYIWLQVMDPQSSSASNFASSLGAGERAAIELALEHTGSIVLLDDGLARRVAQESGLTTWGTLRILLEAKEHGLTDTIAPLVTSLADAGMWISKDIRTRILQLAREDEEQTS